MHVKDVMTNRVQHCAPETILAVAIETMWNSDCSSLLVVENGRLTGVVTHRDISIALGARNCAASEMIVRDVQTTVITTCEAGDGLLEAMNLMQAARVRLLPVVDGDGMLQGTVTLSDLIDRIERKPGATMYEKLVQTLIVIGEYPVSTLVSEIEVKLAQPA